MDNLVPPGTLGFWNKALRERTDPGYWAPMEKSSKTLPLSLGANGTQAAGEFISRRDYLDEAFRSAPPDWQKKNLQVVLRTTLTDSVAGPPRVVATYFW